MYELDEWNFTENIPKSRNICVAVRFRPSILKKAETCENEEASKETEKRGIADLKKVWLLNSNPVIPCVIDNIRGVTYYYDHVFESSFTNEDIYNVLVRNIVHSCLRGVNGTILAYGQTASGKTYTMLGSEDKTVNGIIHMAVKEIFTLINLMLDREFVVSLSYLEVYNEKLIDLISNYNSATNMLAQTQQDIHIVEKPDGLLDLRNLEVKRIISPQDVYDVLIEGERVRHIGETVLNERSSRSHTILRIRIESISNFGEEKYSDNNGCNKITGNSQGVRVGLLNLVDLAGSEGVNRAQTEGERKREGGNINKSLLALSQVISQLSEQAEGKFKGSRQYINFRDSKLTRLLSDSLGGNSQTAIICTCSEARINYRETCSTLEFARRAKKIRNKVKVNVFWNNENSEIRKLKTEIKDLQLRLQLVNFNAPIDANLKLQVVENENFQLKLERQKLEEKIGLLECEIHRHIPDSNCSLDSKDNANNQSCARISADIAFCNSSSDSSLSLSSSSLSSSFYSSEVFSFLFCTSYNYSKSVTSHNIRRKTIDCSTYLNNMTTNQTFSNSPILELCESCKKLNGFQMITACPQFDDSNGNVLENVTAWRPSFESNQTPSGKSKCSYLMKTSLPCQMCKLLFEKMVCMHSDNEFLKVKIQQLEYIIYSVPPSLPIIGISSAAFVYSSCSSYSSFFDSVNEENYISCGSDNHIKDIKFYEPKIEGQTLNKLENKEKEEMIKFNDRDTIKRRRTKEKHEKNEQIQEENINNTRMNELKHKKDNKNENFLLNYKTVLDMKQNLSLAHQEIYNLREKLHASVTVQEDLTLEMIKLRDDKIKCENIVELKTYENFELQNKIELVKLNYSRINQKYLLFFQDYEINQMHYENLLSIMENYNENKPLPKSEKTVLDALQENERHKSEINFLQDQIKSLKGEKEILLQENKEFSFLIHELQNKLEKQKELSNVEKKNLLEKIEEEKEKAYVAEEDFRIQTALLHKNIIQLKDKLEENEIKLSNFQALRDKWLDNDNDKDVRIINQLEESKKNIYLLTEELNSLQILFNEIQEKEKSVRQELEQMKTKEKDMYKEKKFLEEKAQTLENDYNDLKKQLDNYKNEKQELLGKLKDCKTNCECKVEVKEMQCHKLRLEIDDLSSRIDSLTNFYLAREHEAISTIAFERSEKIKLKNINFEFQKDMKYLKNLNKLKDNDVASLQDYCGEILMLYNETQDILNFLITFIHNKSHLEKEEKYISNELKIIDKFFEQIEKEDEQIAADMKIIIWSETVEMMSIVEEREKAHMYDLIELFVNVCGMQHEKINLKNEEIEKLTKEEEEMKDYTFTLKNEIEKHKLNEENFNIQIKEMQEDLDFIKKQLSVYQSISSDLSLSINCASNSNSIIVDDFAQNYIYKAKKLNCVKLLSQKSEENIENCKKDDKENITHVLLSDKGTITDDIVDEINEYEYVRNKTTKLIIEEKENVINNMNNTQISLCDENKLNEEHINSDPPMPREVYRLRKSLREKEKMIFNFKESALKDQKQLINLKKELKEERENNERNMEEMLQEMHESKNMLMNIEMKAEKKEEEIKHLQEVLKAKQQIIETLQLEIAELKTKLIALEKQNNSLKRSNEKLCEENFENERDNFQRNLRLKMQQLHETVETQKNELNRARNEIEKLVMQIKTYEKYSGDKDIHAMQIKNKTEEIKKLKEYIINLKEENENIKQELIINNLSHFINKKKTNLCENNDNNSVENENTIKYAFRDNNSIFNESRKCISNIEFCNSLKHNNQSVCSSLVKEEKYDNSVQDLIKENRIYNDNFDILNDKHSIKAENKKEREDTKIDHLNLNDEFNEINKIETKIKGKEYNTEDEEVENECRVQ